MCGAVSGLALGSAQAQRRGLSWLCSGHGGWDKALLVVIAVGSWPVPGEPSPGTVEWEFGQGCTDKPALCRGTDLCPCCPWEMWELYWALNAFSALRVDLCMENAPDLKLPGSYLGFRHQSCSLL